MPDEPTEPTPDPVKECESQVEELQEENATLRESAETFGALAERLNKRAMAARRANAAPPDDDKDSDSG